MFHTRLTPACVLGGPRTTPIGIFSQSAAAERDRIARCSLRGPVLHQRLAPRLPDLNELRGIVPRTEFRKRALVELDGGRHTFGTHSGGQCLLRGMHEPVAPT